MRTICGAAILALLVGCSGGTERGASGPGLRLGISEGATLAGSEHANCENQKKSKDTYPLDCTGD
jgi:hypothetical protein